MRTLSSGTQVEVEKKDTELGWLAEISFESVTFRVSSYGNLTWNGQAYAGAALQVSGIDGDVNGAQLRFFDQDASIRTLCLTGKGVRNRAVRIWKFYVNALGTSDPMCIFVGVGDELTIGGGYVTVSCTREGGNVLFAPRRRLGPGTGANFLMPPGSILPSGARTIIPQRPGR